MTVTVEQVQTLPGLTELFPSEHASDWGVCEKPGRESCCLVAGCWDSPQSKGRLRYRPVNVSLES